MRPRRRQQVQRSLECIALDQQLQPAEQLPLDQLRHLRHHRPRSFKRRLPRTQSHERDHRRACLLGQPPPPRAARSTQPLLGDRPALTTIDQAPAESSARNRRRPAVITRDKRLDRLLTVATMAVALRAQPAITRRSLVPRGAAHQTQSLLAIRLSRPTCGKRLELLQRHRAVAVAVQSLQVVPRARITQPERPRAIHLPRPRTARPLAHVIAEQRVIHWRREQPGLGSPAAGDQRPEVNFRLQPRKLHRLGYRQWDGHAGGAHRALSDARLGSATLSTAARRRSRDVRT